MMMLNPLPAIIGHHKTGSGAFEPGRLLSYGSLWSWRDPASYALEELWRNIEGKAPAGNIQILPPGGLLWINRIICLRTRIWLCPCVSLHSTGSESGRHIHKVVGLEKHEKRGRSAGSSIHGSSLISVSRRLCGCRCGGSRCRRKLVGENCLDRPLILENWST